MPSRREALSSATCCHPAHSPTSKPHALQGWILLALMPEATPFSLLPRNHRPRPCSLSRRPFSRRPSLPPETRATWRVVPMLLHAHSLLTFHKTPALPHASMAHLQPLALAQTAPLLPPHVGLPLTRYSPTKQSTLTHQTALIKQPVPLDLTLTRQLLRAPSHQTCATLLNAWQRSLAMPAHLRPRRSVLMVPHL